MTISILAWIKKLRHPKRIPCGGGEITAEEWRSAAILMRRRDSSPPAPRSKPEPTGGRLIRGDVDPGPVPTPLLLAIRSAIDNEPFGDEPRAVLLVVAKWLRSRNNPCHDAAVRLEIEAGR